MMSDEDIRPTPENGSRERTRERRWWKRRSAQFSSSFLALSGWFLEMALLAVFGRRDACWTDMAPGRRGRERKKEGRGVTWITLRHAPISNVPTPYTN